MEYNNIPHLVKLFVSLDSPQQGAYVSLGLQHLIGQLEQVGFGITGISINDLITAMDYYYTLNCDAAKQMLVYHYSATTNNHAYPNPMRTEFLNELNSLGNGGYPQYVKMIGIAEGSGNDTDQGYDAGSVQMNLNTSKYLGSNKTLYCKIIISALPDHTSNNILDLHIILKVPSIFGGSYTWITFGPLDMKTIPINSTKPYDNAPGGKKQVVAIMDEMFSGIFNATPTYYKSECFIPTISALDLKNTNDLNYNVYNNLTGGKPYTNISNSSVTKFDVIYANNYNADHIQNGIDVQLTNWLYNQVINSQNINRPDIYIQNQTISNVTNEFSTSGKISCGRDVNYLLPLGDVEIKNNSHIILRANEGVIIDKGFSLEQNSSLEIYNTL